jgi:hypothetical protein
MGVLPEFKKMERSLDFNLRKQYGNLHQGERNPVFETSLNPT